MTPEQYDKSEEEFFEMYNKVQDYLKSYPELRFEQVLSVRQVWDYAWSNGHLAGMEEALTIVKDKN